MPAAATVTAVIDAPVDSERDLVLQLLRGFGVVSVAVDPAIPLEELLGSLEQFLAGLAPLGMEAEVRIRPSVPNREAIISRLGALNLHGRPLLTMGAAPVAVAATDADSPVVTDADDSAAAARTYRLRTAATAAGAAALIGIGLSATLVYFLTGR